VVRGTQTRRAASERYTEIAAGKTVLEWRGNSCTVVRYETITLSDGVTRKRCAVVLIHGKDLFQSLRFVDAKELSDA